MTRRLARRVGRRGGFLLFLALLDALYGYGLLSAPVPGVGGYGFGLPITVWAAGWFTAAAACVLCSPLALPRDRGGFIASAVMNAAWACEWAHLWLVQGYPHGWVSLVVWATFAGVVVMVSGWAEIPPRDLP